VLLRFYPIVSQYIPTLTSAIAASNNTVPQLLALLSTGSISGIQSRLNQSISDFTAFFEQVIWATALVNQSSLLDAPAAVLVNSSVLTSDASNQLASLLHDTYVYDNATEFFNMVDLITGLSQYMLDWMPAFYNDVGFFTGTGCDLTISSISCSQQYNQMISTLTNLTYFSRAALALGPSVSTAFGLALSNDTDARMHSISLSLPGFTSLSTAASAFYKDLGNITEDKSILQLASETQTFAAGLSLQLSSTKTHLASLVNELVSTQVSSVTCISKCNDQFVLECAGFIQPGLRRSH
jgi:hypothetical protein